MSFVPFQRDELMRIRERAEGVVGLNCLVPTWQRAYLELADAADHLDAMESRTSGVGGFPSNVPDQPAATEQAVHAATPERGSVASDGSHFGSNYMPFVDPPLHMDQAARNRRLYDKLLSMGLFVTPIPDKSGGIDCFLVSAGMPNYVPQVQG